MMRLAVVKLFVKNHEEARRFYVDRLGFVVSEDNQLGDYRWLLVRPPDGDSVRIVTREFEDAQPAKTFFVALMRIGQYTLAVG